MATANRGCCSHTDAEHLRNADPNHGSHDGRLGGATQTTKSDGRLVISDAVQAKILAWRRHDLAERSDESLAVLDAICGPVPEILDRNDDFLEQGWKATLNILHQLFL